jgi:hypothetical protein
MFAEIKTEVNHLSNRLAQELKSFHQEDRGAAGSVDNVMLIFVAGVILIALIALFNDTVTPAVTGKLGELFGN